MARNFGLVAEGLSPEEAERTARVAFGSVTGTRERFYRSRRLSWLDDLARDVRFGLRTLSRAPGFSLVSVATLALATGAATALFSTIDAALLRAVPYERPDEIVAINVGESGVQI